MMGAYDFSRERITEHLQTLKTAGAPLTKWHGPVSSTTLWRKTPRYTFPTQRPRRGKM